MGIIRNQSIKSTIITYIGFTVGAINAIFIMPHVLSTPQIGLITVYLALAAQMIAVGSFGTGVIINKFLPYYRAHLLPKKNDLLSIALLVGTLGLLLVLFLSFLNKDLIIRKFNRNSPLLIDYLYLFPFFTFGYLYYYILELFNNNYRFSAWSSFVRELFYKTFNLIIVLLFAIHWLSFNGIMNLYSLMYWIGALLLLLNLARNNLFHIPLRLSSLTRKLKFNLLKYSLSTWGISMIGITYQFIDIFAITGLIGLGSVAIYNVPKFLVSAIVIPSSSVISISVPLISEAWRKNNLLKIEEIYKKTALVLVLLCGAIFFLIWANIDDILHLLPDKFYGSEANFIAAKYAILFLGAARMCDFATSVNGYILQNSKKYYWIDLYYNIFLILMMIPLNYIMIKKHGILGAAYANFIAFFITNSLKALYLYVKEKIHPFSKKWKLLLVVFISAIIVSYLLNYLLQIPLLDSFISSIPTRIGRIVIRTLILCTIFIPIVYRLNISNDITSLIDSILKKVSYKNHRSF